MPNPVILSDAFYLEIQPIYSFLERCGVRTWREVMKEGGRERGGTDRDRQTVVLKTMLGEKDKRWDTRGKFLYTAPQFVGM